MTLRQAIARESWMDEALCAQTDPELWFPKQRALGGSPRAAKEICQQCPVAVQCLSYAMDHVITHGIWGGLTAKQRQELRRNRPKNTDPNICVNGHDRSLGVRADGACKQCRREQDQARRRARRDGRAA